MFAFTGGGSDNDNSRRCRVGSNGFRWNRSFSFSTLVASFLYIVTISWQPETQISLAHSGRRTYTHNTPQYKTVLSQTRTHKHAQEKSTSRQIETETVSRSSSSVFGFFSVARTNRQKHGTNLPHRHDQRGKKDDRKNGRDERITAGEGAHSNSLLK